MGKYKEHKRAAQEFAKKTEVSDHLYWCKNKYFTTISGDSIEYNFNYAMAIEIVGNIVKLDTEQVSHCHAGVKYIARNTGATSREVKSLKRTFKKHMLSDADRYVYRVSYKAWKILECIIETLEKHKNTPLVSKFLKKNKDTILYRTILVNKEYMAIRDAYNRLDNDERKKEEKFSTLYLKLSDMK